MIKIEVKDTEKGYNVDCTMSGTVTELAEQLNAIINAVHEREPKIIDVMIYLQQMGFKPEEQ